MLKKVFYRFQNYPNLKKLHSDHETIV